MYYRDGDRSCQYAKKAPIGGYTQHLVIHFSHIRAFNKLDEVHFRLREKLGKAA